MCGCWSQEPALGGSVSLPVGSTTGNLVGYPLFALGFGAILWMNFKNAKAVKLNAAQIRGRGVTV